MSDLKIVNDTIKQPANKLNLKTKTDKSIKPILDSAFENLNLPTSLIKILNKINFKQMTPVQAESIPAALENLDILGSAQTGTGKTGAFVIPLITKILQNNNISALILTPTRELAMQVSDFIRKLCIDDIRINSVLLIGGESIFQQLDKLKKRPQIIIGTPGRVIDHLERKSLNLLKTNLLVLDETDRMLDMGFGLQLDRIIEDMPKTRQTLMFSATISKQIEKIAAKYLNNPTRITIGSDNAPIEKINQTTVNLNESEKLDHLVNEINKRDGSVIVFAKTRIKTEKLSAELFALGQKNKFINGDLHQNKRKRIIEDFRKEKFRILIATDIAARGLDISHIKLVVNYDLPDCAEDYIHRIGRTARAGAEGDAISLIARQDEEKWQAILRLIDPSKAINKRLTNVTGTKRKRSSTKFNDRPNKSFKFYDEKKSFSNKKPRFSNNKENDFFGFSRGGATQSKRADNENKKDFFGNKSGYKKNEQKKFFGNKDGNSSKKSNFNTKSTSFAKKRAFSN